MNDTTYTLAHQDKSRILSAARKALIAADEKYYAWPSEKQERFRANMSEQACRKVDCILLGSLLNIQCSTEDVDAVWRDIPISDLNPLNWAKLLTNGVGEDFIFLNESLADGKTLLDYSTLYDYDYADHLFQEEARTQDCSDYEGTNYYAFQFSRWVRLLINEQFYYSNFTSLATYILDEVESAGNETINELIPHQYIDGKDHGKQEKGGFLWDFKIDAAGNEAQLDELKHRWYGYQLDRWLALSEAMTQQPPAVYSREQTDDKAPHRDFVFANEATLKQIRWRHFLTDCEPLIVAFSDTESLVSEEIERANSWLSDNCQDIQDNFDPSVIKLRRMRKIIMSPSALDDLRKIEEDELKD